MDVLIFRFTIVSTQLGKPESPVDTLLGFLDSGFRFGFLTAWILHFCLPYACFHALLLALFPCFIACLVFICFIACLPLFTLFLALYMPKYLLDAMIHAFWVISASLYTIAMPLPMQMPCILAF